ncbi:MAG: lipase family protein [Candidatus Riesia sp.]|nr:lipase family protein [Candidatus Riesia sp.]
MPKGYLQEFDKHLAELCFKATFKGAATEGQTQACFEETDTEFIACLAGTNSLKDIYMRDLDFKLVSFPLKGKVHRGFLREAETVLPWIRGMIRDRNKKVVLSGYSFGGAVATLVARFLTFEGHKVELVTFGCPRIGNKEWALERAQPHIRYVHRSDFIPYLPFWMMHDAKAIRVGSVVASPLLGHLMYIS